MNAGIPGHYRKLQAMCPDLIGAAEALGKRAREASPLDEKSVQLIQLGASAALRSEGAVHSHARRAMQAGATPEEVRHAVIVLTSTIGFPTVTAALGWRDSMLGEAGASDPSLRRPS